MTDVFEDFRPVGRVLAGLLLAVLLAAFCAGYVVAESRADARGRAVRADLLQLRDSVAGLTYWAGVDRAAAVRAESVARQAEQRAHAAAERAAVARGRIVVVGPVVVATPDSNVAGPADTLATDPRVAEALAAQDRALAEAAAARVLLLAALDSVGAALASERQVSAALRVTVAKQQVLLEAPPSKLARLRERIGVMGGYGATAARDGTIVHGPSVTVGIKVL